MKLSNYVTDARPTTFLQPEFAAAYVTLLSSIATSHLYLDDVARCSDSINAALRAAKPLEENLAFAPVFARTLGLAGRIQFTAGMSAEGERSRGVRFMLESNEFGCVTVILTELGGLHAAP